MNEISIEDLDPGGLAFLISPHLKKLSKTSPAIHKQFFPSPAENNDRYQTFTDPLIEDQFEKTKGLIHKYDNRALILLTQTCASYCRFCTRRRRVGDIVKNSLSKTDIDNVINYLKNTSKISEVIFSGGDPLTNQDTLIYTLNKISKVATIKIIRIHTRVPISNPKLVSSPLLSAIKKLFPIPIYISLHFEHPDEITPPTKKIIIKLRKTHATLLSQSVFLKNINDDYQILFTLFTKLSQLGIRPYYLYHCDPVKGAGHFIVPFEKEIDIMTRLRNNLSGIACPTFVIDTPNGYGKIPVPLNYWKFDHRTFVDFKNKNHPLITSG